MVFIPKADTTGCTKEAISFSNLIKDFDDLNTIVIGISKDSIESLKIFKKKYKVPFDLLSDPDVKSQKNMVFGELSPLWEKSFLAQLDQLCSLIKEKIEKFGQM